MADMLIGVQGDETARPAMLIGVQGDETARPAMLIGVSQEVVTVQAIAYNFTDTNDVTLESVATCAAGTSTGLGVSCWLEYAVYDVTPDTLRLRLQVKTDDDRYASVMLDVHSEFVGWDEVNHLEDYAAFSVSNEVYANGSLMSESVSGLTHVPPRSDYQLWSEIQHLYAVHDFRLTITDATARFYHGTTLVCSWTAATTPPSDWVEPGHIEISAVLNASWTSGISGDANYITADGIIVRGPSGWIMANPGWTGSDDVTGYEHAVRALPIVFDEP